MKKYSELILESLLTRPSFVYKLGMSKKFIIYKCGMFKAINRLLKENSTPKNFNSEYQMGLSILYKTGKYSDIENNGGVYNTKELENLYKVLDSNGEWHPVNKLNTNSFDQAEILYDLYNKLGVYDEVGNIRNENDLKNWVMEYNNSVDLYSLIKNNLNFKNYISWNRKNSALGQIAEDKVRQMLESKGCQILYQGGDGDFIDMTYGIDLIVSKDDKIYTVQVKSKEDAVKEAFDKSMSGEDKSYVDIDWFCSPTDSGIKIFTKGNFNGKDIF
jgi:hypothetical protein